MQAVYCPVCQNAVNIPMGALPICPGCGLNLTTVYSYPSWVVRGVDLRKVARLQRRLILYVLAILLVNCFMIPAALGMSGNSGNTFPAVVLLIYGAALIMHIAVAVSTIQLFIALRSHIATVIICGVLLFIGCANLIILLIANRYATNALRNAGLSVGLFGVSDEKVLRLTTFYRCRQCGYNMIGNTSGRCPECGTPYSPSPFSQPAAPAPAAPAPGTPAP